MTPSAADALAGFVSRHPRLLVLTGAGCSTEAGIPDYRDESGQWKRRQPVHYPEFVRSETMRRRYWARSMVGWAAFGAAAPAAPHRALAALERAGRLHHLITQNVDGLHQRAGSRAVTDLHGRLDGVECLACGGKAPRAALQSRLEALNPDWRYARSKLGPDGDADLADADYEAFRVPGCEACGGVLKPSVVFFGEQVPVPRVRACYEKLSGADALLVAGSSLMVYSGYRFVRAAKRAGQPVAVINLGRTRADGELDLKVEGACGEVLFALGSALSIAM